MAQKLSRRKLAEYVAEQLRANADVQKLAKQIVAYLAENKQLNQLELLIRDVEAECAAQYGVVTARVTSARPLDEATKDVLQQFVKAAEQASDVVIADDTVNPDLIGGVVVQTPSSTFDSSIRTKLRQLTATTKE